MRCPDCGEDKPLTPEYWHRRAHTKTGFQNRCKPCMSLRVTSRPGREANIARVREIKETTPCADCGRYYPFYVMDFDHLDGEQKTAEIARMLHGSWAWASIEAEIAKCELVCSNCHRSRTYFRANIEPLL